MAKSGIADKVKDGEYLEAWRQFKDEHPGAYTAAAVAPVTGQAAAVADYVDAMDRGDTADAVNASVSVIPGVKLIKNSRMAKRLLAPTQVELDIAKVVKPGSARAKLAPVTQRSDKIGKAAAAEQVGEYGVNKAHASEQEAKEYAEAWGNEARK